jgi:hypothetical protein
MTVGGTETRGDGSLRHPGCDINGDGVYDDSRIAQAKGALTDTIAAFGSAEFALARYKATDGSLQCNNDATCTTAFGNNWTCADPTHIAGTQKYCMRADRQGCSNGGECYAECVPKKNGGYTCPANCYVTKTGGTQPDPWDIYVEGVSCSMADLAFIQRAKAAMSWCPFQQAAPTILSCCHGSMATKRIQLARTKNCAPTDQHPSAARSILYANGC